MDDDGEIRKAICYQKDANELHIWFKFEDMISAFKKWEIPTPSYYFNGKRWSPNMKNEYAHLEKDNKNIPNPQTKKYNNKKTDSRYSNNNRSNNHEKEEDRKDDRQEHRYYKDEDYWVRSNREALDEMYGNHNNYRVGAGRGSVPQDDSRGYDHHSTGARSRPQSRRSDSPRRYDDDYRDYSRERYRDRRHSERSNSRERRKNSDMDRDRKASYGNKGRY